MSKKMLPMITTIVVAMSTTGAFAQATIYNDNRTFITDNSTTNNDNRNVSYGNDRRPDTVDSSAELAAVIGLLGGLALASNNGPSYDPSYGGWLNQPGAAYHYGSPFPPPYAIRVHAPPFRRW